MSDNDRINETNMELLFADNLTATAQVYATLANDDTLVYLSNEIANGFNKF